MEHKSVVIIGAGLSGMYAANYLNGLGVQDLVVLEAQDCIGGRVKGSSTLFDFPREFEIGAELLHGANSLFAEISHDLPKTFAFNLNDEDKNRQVLYFSRQKNTIYFQNDPTIVKMHEVLDEADTLEPGKDCTLYEYIAKATNNDAEMQGLIDTVVATTNASDTKNQGVLGMLEEDRRCISGEENFVFNKGHSSVTLQRVSDPIKDKIRINSPVLSVIKESANLIRIIYGKNHTSITCNYVICTTPLSMLRHTKREKKFANEQLTFQPSLPKEKQDAIDNRLEMFGGLKVFCQFSKKYQLQFKSSKNLVLGFATDHPFTPQFWFPVSETEKCMTVGFCCGPKANAWTESGEPDHVLVQHFVKLLDEFCVSLAKKDGVKNYVLPSQCFEKGYVQNWTTVPYIRGGYSSSPLNAVGSRDVISKPCWGNHLFFAGEHTNCDACGTIHGALESGRRAAREVVREMLVNLSAQNKAFQVPSKL